MLYTLNQIGRSYAVCVLLNAWLGGTNVETFKVSAEAGTEVANRQAANAATRLFFMTISLTSVVRKLQ